MAIDHQLQWYSSNLPLAGAVVADVGANVGRLSAGLLAHGDERTRVVSIEPLPENLRVLRGKAADHPRWTVAPYAVSDRDGRAILRREHDEHGFNSVVWTGGGDAAVDTVDVETRALPGLVPDATVVKLDIEGHEYVVLDHALPRLSGVSAWAVELHRVPSRPLERALSAFVEHGYRLVAATRRPGDASGTWVSAAIPPTLTWDRIPVAKRHADGRVFKMLHVLALR